MYLTGCINGLHGLSCQRVPEPDAPVGGASAARQQTMVMRGPGDCLNEHVDYA